MDWCRVYVTHIARNREKRDFSSCIKHLFAHTKIVIRKKERQQRSLRRAIFSLLRCHCWYSLWKCAAYSIRVRLILLDFPFIWNTWLCLHWHFHNHRTIINRNEMQLLANAELPRDKKKFHEMYILIAFIVIFCSSDGMSIFVSRRIYDDKKKW